jgi:type II secretory pathway pseudopilin PulG
MIPAPARRRGLTVIEVLVLLGIVGLVVALVLPAVRKVRDAEARTSCVNNLKQVVLATHNYNDTYGKLPPLAGAPVENGRPYPQSFFFVIVPFIEAGPTYGDGMRRATTPGLTWTGPAGSGQIYNACFCKPYVCRADPTNPGTRLTACGWVGASYGANYQVFGTEDWDSKYRLGKIPDGSTYTIFLADRFAQFPGPDGRFTDPDGIPQQACNLWAWPANYPPNPPTAYRSPVPQNAAMFAYHNLDTGQGYGEVVFRQPQVGIGAFEADYRSVQSGHAGVVQVGMGDGSVHAVSARVSQPTWQNAVTPADGQTFGSDW